MLKKINTRDLTLGMHVHKFCGRWLDHPFWRSDFTLESHKDILTIRQSNITEVVIDTHKGLGIVTHFEPCDLTPPELPDQIIPAPKTVPMGDEIKQATKVYAKSKKAIQSMFNDARMGKSIDLSTTKTVVSEISQSVMRNSDALISIMRIKTADEYTYMHSVAVCALMIALANSIGLDQEECTDAGIAGLLHDIGKTKMPDDILNKPGKLTDQEYALMKTHPDEGYKILTKHYNVGATALDVCLHHHEKIDGSGYPMGLKGDQISLLSRMGAICDVYDAVTSDRPYKKGWNAAEALQRMSQWKGHFDPQLFQGFVKMIGIYPIGCLVGLASGKIGVVYEQNKGTLLKPRVKVFFSSRLNTYIKAEVIDFSDPSIKDKIVGPELPERWDIKDINHYWTD
ncbi:HD-GYP domain-containing protein [Porticoccaceae bacterium]|nr:HD-GYP domain-containing protein [Porticoccaceae bacterium]